MGLTSYAIIGSMGACLLLTGALWVQSGRVSKLKAELAATEAQIEQYKHAAVVHKKYVEKTHERERAWSEMLREIQEMEGRNAPLSDHLGAVARRLWP